MLFLVEWTIAPEHRNAAIERFKKTQGAPPPGVKIVGRWHAANQAFGFAVAEASDPGAISSWCWNWSDLLSLEVQPLLDDEAFSRVIA